MRTKLLNLFRWFAHRLPEVLLALFLLGVALLLLFVVQAAVMQGARMWEHPSEYFSSIADEPWPASAIAMCVVGTALVLFLLWRNWVIIWAVARKMIIEALHRKVVLVLLVFFVVLILSLPFLLKTEGSIKSQVQIVLLYSLVLAMVLLSLVAIFVSAASICSEVERKEVQITDTKPLRRWQFLVGKWFGTVVLCSAVLFVMAGAGYGLVCYLAREPDYGRMTEREEAKARKEYDELLDQVLVARRSVKCVLPPGLEREVDRRMQEVREAGEVPQSVTLRVKARALMRDSLIASKMIAYPGGAIGWKFRGLEPGQKGDLYVRFKGYASAAGRRLVGRWIVVQRQLVPVEGKEGEYQEKGVPVYMVLSPEGGWASSMRREIKIPAQFVGSDGVLYLVYENLNTRGTVQFDGQFLVEVMQRTGHFFPNYYRSVVIVFCHVALLAALGLMAGSVFSFPVASLTVVFFFIAGVMGPWLVQFGEPGMFVEYTAFQEVMHAIVRNLFRSLLAIVPHFGAFNPLGDLTDGKLVSWTSVFGAGVIMFYIKGGLALLIGVYFYSRRELARVIV